MGRDQKQVHGRSNGASQKLVTDASVNWYGLALDMRPLRSPRNPQALSVATHGYQGTRASMITRCYSHIEYVDSNPISLLNYLTTLTLETVVSLDRVS